jgi:hypothetical protein
MIGLGTAQVSSATVVRMRLSLVGPIASVGVGIAATFTTDARTMLERWRPKHRAISALEYP